MNFVLIFVINTVDNLLFIILKKMGTHLWKNGYYILEKWVPISYVNGYPFFDCIVLFGTKYSGEIENSRLLRDFMPLLLVPRRNLIYNFKVYSIIYLEVAYKSYNVCFSSCSANKKKTTRGCSHSWSCSLDD